MTMKITQRPLNHQALALEEAQGKIRLAVKDGAFLREPTAQTAAKVRLIINEALKKITIPNLKDAARRSLIDFYSRAVQTVRQLRQTDLITFLALGRFLIANKSKVRTDNTVPASSFFNNISLNEADRLVSNIIPQNFNTNNYASALNIYHKEYMERVKVVVDRLAKIDALDPDSAQYIGQRQTLRARAEREVRYQGHIDEIEDFKARGIKLVIISAHADCSPRCAPFQGKVFSLDGTSGTTSDGRRYEPLEKATNILTRNGRWYNGLFGFNCRHYMVEYKPNYRFPKVSREEERKQYRIDINMRRMERGIISAKTEAQMYKGVNKSEYDQAKAKVKTLIKQYENYARKNKRVAFDSRIKII